MKATRKLISLLLVLLALAGCRDITVKTTVDKDGSFTRTITIKGDSLEVLDMDLPYPVDSTWVRQMLKDTAKEDNYIVTYTKHFGSSDLVNAELDSDTSWMRQLHRQVTVSRRFGLFYSYLTFRTVYPVTNPFNALDFHKYLTADDLLWLEGRKAVTDPADSTHIKEAEDKAFKYLEMSAGAEITQILEGMVRNLNDPQLKPEDVARYQDSIRAAVSAWKFKSAAEFAGYYRKWTGNAAADRLNSLAPAAFADFDRRSEFLDKLLTFRQFHEQAEMPGIITGTNSLVLKGNEVSWEVDPMAFLLEDYVMFAESRVINIWGFVATGIVLLALLALLVLKAFRK